MSLSGPFSLPIFPITAHIERMIERIREGLKASTAPSLAADDEYFLLYVINNHKPHCELRKQAAELLKTYILNPLWGQLTALARKRISCKDGVAEVVEKAMRAAWIRLSIRDVSESEEDRDIRGRLKPFVFGILDKKIKDYRRKISRTRKVKESRINKLNDSPAFLR